MKTAFDLDGVFIPDCDEIPELGGLVDFYRLTMYMRPIFTPEGEYAIITARPAEYRSITHTWIHKYLSPSPIRLFHECVEETPGAYKARILNENSDIQIYVESDEFIVKYLKQHVNTGCEIIHFDEYLANKFTN